METKQQKDIPMWQILSVLAFLIASLYYTIVVVEGWAHIPIALTAAVATAVAVANGYKWSAIEQGIITSISRSMQAILILLVIGMLIGTWITAGIVPAMIYYGLKIMSPGIFLVAGCLLCSVVSLATGSSWTTAATVGIALIGIGTGLGIPVPMIAGAIISGAYFGDKMSPLSDSTNLAPAIAGSNLFDHVRHMIKTTGPSLLISLVLFGILGMKYAGQELDTTLINELLDGLSGAFYISPVLLIAPVLVILMVVFKVPALPGLFGGFILGGIFTLLFQDGTSFAELFNVAYRGYVPDLGNDFLNSLLERGGLKGMYYTVGLILCAMTMGGVMDQTGMLSRLAEKILRLAVNTGSLVLITVVSCIVSNIVAADQYLAIVLPGRMFKEAFEDRRLKPKNLSRVLEDSGTLTSALVPWNTCGAYMQSVLAISPFAYLPYAFLNLINPLISIFYGFTGITMEKMTEEEYQEILKEREAAKVAV